MPQIPGPPAGLAAMTVTQLPSVLCLSLGSCRPRVLPLNRSGLPHCPCLSPIALPSAGTGRALWTHIAHRKRNRSHHLLLPVTSSVTRPSSPGGPQAAAQAESPRPHPGVSDSQAHWSSLTNIGDCTPAISSLCPACPPGLLPSTVSPACSWPFPF